jgi:tetratricopeptide (TPR) repeat protein
LGCILFELCTGSEALPGDYTDFHPGHVPFVPHEFDEHSGRILSEWLYQIWDDEPERRPSADVLLGRLGCHLPTVPKLFRWEELFPGPANETHTIATRIQGYKADYSIVLTLFGEQHPKAIVSGTRLAYAYLLAGQCQLAQNLFSRIIEKQRLAQEAGEQVEWGMTLYGLGQAYLHLAEQTNLHFAKSKSDKESERLRNEGIECFKECQYRHDMRSGKNDPNSLLGCYGVALACSKFTDRKHEAVKLAQMTHRLQSRTLSQDHRDTLTTKSLLLWLEDEYGEADETLEALGEIMERRKESLGPDHPDTLESLAGIGWAYSIQSNEAEGLTYIREAHEGRARVLGWQHPRTANSAGCLAWAYDEMNLPSIELFEKAEELLRVAFGTNDRRTKNVASRLKELRNL